MKYTYVSDYAKYCPEMNKALPWSAFYTDELDRTGMKFFKSLDDALKWINDAELVEYPF